MKLVDKLKELQTEINESEIVSHDDVNLDITQNGMKAFLTLTPSENQKITPPELVDIIKKTGIKHGLKKKDLQDAYIKYKNGEIADNQLIAEASINTFEPSFSSIEFSFKHTQEVPSGKVVASFKLLEQTAINVYGQKVSAPPIDPSEEWKGKYIRVQKTDEIINFVADMSGIFLIHENRLSIFPFDYDRIKINEREDGSKITINIKAKENEDRPISINRIEEYVAIKEIDPAMIDWKRIQEAISKANSGIDVVGFEIQSHIVQAPIKVDIGTSEDELYAHISIVFPEHRIVKVSFEQVKRAINSASISYGFKWDDIRELIEDVNSNIGPDGRCEDLYDHVFAMGDESFDGKEGSFKFEVEFTQKVTERVSGSLISNTIQKGAIVKKGDILATQTLGFPGRNGKTVKGRILEVITGQTKFLQTDKNVRVETDVVDPDEQVFYAEASGMVQFNIDTGGLSVLPYKDADFEIEVSHDKMLVKLKLTSPVGEGKKIDPKMVEGYLEDEKIMLNSGARQKIKAMITRLHKEGLPNLEDVITSGLEPIHGKDGKIIFIKKPRRPHFPADRITHDYSKPLGVVSIKKNDIIGYLVKPTDDTKDGYNVYGEAIPAKRGSSDKIALGENLFVEDRTLKIRATSSGILKIKDDTPHVIDVEEVSYLNNDTEFKGSVVIKSSIDNSIKVTARHDIFIFGSAKNVEFHAGGNIIITGDAYNCGIKSDNFIGVLSAEASILHSQNNIEVRETLNKCTVRCGGNVTMLKQGKGHIINSNIMATNGITASVIGDGRYPVKVKTGIMLQKEDIDSTIADIEKKMVNADEVEKAMHQVKIENLRLERSNLATLERNIVGIISVKEKILPPCIIKIKDKEIEINDEIDKAMFTLAPNGEIIKEALPEFEI